MTFLNDNFSCTKLCFHTAYRSLVSSGSVEGISESAQLLSKMMTDNHHICQDTTNPIYSKNPLTRNPFLKISLFGFLYKDAISRNSLKCFLI